MSASAQAAPRAPSVRYTIGATSIAPTCGCTPEWRVRSIQLTAAPAPLADLVARVAARAPIAELELVGLAPAAALEGLPADLPLRGFDPDRHVIENALRSAGL